MKGYIITPKVIEFARNARKSRKGGRKAKTI